MSPALSSAAGEERVAGDVAAAALLVSWEPGELSSYAGPEVGPADPELLEELSRLLRTGSRQLRDDVRGQVLGQLGLEGAKKARAANPAAAPGTVQELLDRLLDGTAPPPAEWREDWVAVGARVIGWLRSIPQLPLPSPDELTRIRDRQELLRPLRRAAERLRGQDAALAEIARYKEARYQDNRPPEPALLVRGLGGSGKSTLVARAFVDHIDAGGLGAYLDFDAAGLDLGSVAAAEAGLESVGPDPRLTVVVRELARQLGVLHPDLSYSWLAREIADVDGLLRLLESSRDLRFLLVLDTAEELQYAGPAAVELVAWLLAELSERCPRLAILLSGRAPVPEITDRELLVPPLTKDIAVQVLQEQAAARDRSIPADQAEALIARVGTFPLHVVIAAHAVSEDPDLINEVRAQELEGRIAAGFLYRRILQHVHRGDLLPIAELGLAVRRIDAGVIREVLAPLRKGEKERVDAEELLNELKREVALGRQVPGGVAFRQEIRDMVLEKLREDLAERWEDLHGLAAEHWSRRRQAEPEGSEAERDARVEELYHRLVLWEDPELVTSLWRPDCGPPLVEAVEEPILPAEAKRFLAEHTADVDGNAAPALSALRRLSRALSEAEGLFAKGNLDEAAQSLLGAAHDPRAQLLLARVHRAKGTEEAMSWASRASEAAESDPVVAHDALLLQAAWLAEDGQEGEALARLGEGLAREEAPIRRLRLLNAHVKLDGRGEERAAEAEQLCLAAGPAVVARDPALLRDLIRWVPSDALLIEALRTFGLDHVSIAERESLLVEVEEWEAQAGTGSGLESLAAGGRVSAEKLHELFLQLFSKTSTIEMFLVENVEWGSFLAKRIPWQGSLYDTTSAVVEQLLRRGLLDSRLRRALLSEFPMRAREINAVFAAGSAARSGQDLAKSIIVIYDRVGRLPEDMADRLRRLLAVDEGPTEIDVLARALQRALPDERVRGAIASELGLDVLDEPTSAPAAAQSADALLEAARRRGRVLALVQSVVPYATAFRSELESAFLADLARRLETALHADPVAARVAVAELREALDPRGSLHLSPDDRLVAVVQALWTRPPPDLRGFVEDLLLDDAIPQELDFALAYLAGIYSPRWGLAEGSRLRSGAPPEAASRLRELRRELVSSLIRRSPHARTRLAMKAELDDLALDASALHHRIGGADPGTAARLVREFIENKPSTASLLVLVRQIEAIHGLSLDHPGLALLRRELSQRTFELPASDTPAADPWLRSALLRAAQVVTVGSSRYGSTTPGVVVDAAWFGVPSRPLVLASLPPALGTQQRLGVAITAWNSAEKPEKTAWSAERWRSIPAPQAPAGTAGGDPPRELVLLDPGETLPLAIPSRASPPSGARVRIGPDLGGGPATRLALGSSESPFFRGPPAPACCPVFDEYWDLAGVHLGSASGGFSTIWTIDELIARFSG